MVNERESLVGVANAGRSFVVIRDRLGRSHIAGTDEIGAMRLGRLGRIGRIGMREANWASRMNTISNSIPDFATKPAPIDYDD
jgi:hypothetical protein